MAFNWKEYFHLAVFLKHQTGTDFSNEASLRSAVSRAYYAVYCYTRNIARDYQSFIPTLGSDDHKNLRNHFKNHKQFKIARHLDKLRQWRNSCDYDDVVHKVSTIYESAIAEAQHVLDKLEQDRNKETA